MMKREDRAGIKRNFSREETRSVKEEVSQSDSLQSRSGS